MAALGDVSRDGKAQPALIALTIPGTLGLGNTDYGREAGPKSTTGGSTGPTLPTFGQIFPTGR